MKSRFVILLYFIINFSSLNVNRIYRLSLSRGFSRFAKIRTSVIISEWEPAHIPELWRSFVLSEPQGSESLGGETTFAEPLPIKLLIQLFSKSWRSRGCVSLVALRRERNPFTNAMCKLYRHALHDGRNALPDPSILNGYPKLFTERE